MDPLLWQLLLQVFLILLNAVFACAEIAVLSVNDAKLAHMASEGNKKAVRLARLKSQPARFLATIQVAITLSGFLGSAFAADNFSHRLVSWLLGLGVGIPENTLNTIAVILITLILSYFTLIFGELVPKRLAMKKAESLALGLSALISFISVIFKPIVSLLSGSTNLVLRLFGVDPESEDESVSEEEILLMVETGSKSGVIDADEQEFIQNVFAFDDLTVGEFATHRTEVAILWMDESLDVWENTIRENRFSLYPVCEETVDNVIGVLSVKDLYLLKDRSRENILFSLRPPYFVPESAKADIIFRNMKQSRNQFAIVLDEYGGVFGIVTINDMLEQLVGDLDDFDDTDPPEPEITALDSGTWLIRGVAPLDEVAEKLDVELPVNEFDTFGGFVFGSHGSYPEDGGELELDLCGLHIKVTEIKSHRVEKAIVCKTEPEPDEETE